MAEPVDARTEAHNIIKKELSNLSDNSPRYRFFLTLADICLISAKYALRADERHHPSRDQDEEPNAKQSSVNSDK